MSTQNELALNVITLPRIKSQQSEWLAAAAEVRTRIVSLTEEITKLQNQLIALDGADQACRVLINIGETQDTFPQEAPAPATEASAEESPSA